MNTTTMIPNFVSRISRWLRFHTNLRVCEQDTFSLDASAPSENCIRLNLLPFRLSEVSRASFSTIRFESTLPFQRRIDQACDRTDSRGLQNGFAETCDHAAAKTIGTIQMPGVNFQLRASCCDARACNKKKRGGDKCKTPVVAACACFEQDLARTTNKSSRESIACSSSSISGGPYQDSVYFRFIEGLRLWASSFL